MNVLSDKFSDVQTHRPTFWHLSSDAGSGFTAQPCGLSGPLGL